MRNILITLKYFFKKLLERVKFNNTKIIPVLFNNTPISNGKEDIFNFKEQVNILESVIKNNSTLIGIIGDYGSGKSSLTELCQKKLKPKYGQAIRINMWDTTEKEDEGSGFRFLMRSFLYQLAQGNAKKNINFARYINERQNRNYGKLSLTMASHWALFWFFLAGLFLIMFFSLTNIDVFNFLINFLVKTEMNTLLTIVKLLKIFSYSVLFIGIIFAYIGIKVGDFVFSLWNSQGKMNPEYGDIFDNYIHIISHCIRFSSSKRKRIIYIEDLDRTNDKILVIPFLKELHRLINILPINQKKKVAFIVSLKSESSLKKELSDDAPKDDKSVYSKIFDYTLWIKPIHNENISDVFWELLRQNQKPIKSILKLDRKTEIPKTLLNDLDWIQKGENLTIREIKDRLNETFILYQTLKARNFENSSVELKKCSAVTYLHRTYPNEYEELLKHEHIMAELIRDCCQWQKNDMLSISNKIATINNELVKEIKTSIQNFINDFKKMLFNADIDEDFMMYFYNYPTSSYIKNLDEKEIFDYIIHPSDKFKDDDNLSDKIKRVIDLKNGKIIEKAIYELSEKKLIIPDIVFEDEQLFVFSFKYNKTSIISALQSYSEKLIEMSDKVFYLLEKILSYNINEEQKIEILCSLAKPIKTNLINSDVNNNISLRTNLIKSIKLYINSFGCLFTKDMPIISKQELELISSPDIKLSLINSELVNANNYINIFEEVNILELNEDQYKKAENLILNIKNIEKLPSIQKYLIAFLSKNKKYQEHLFLIILDKLDDDDDGKSAFCKYLNFIDMSSLTNDQLSKLDEMKLRDISNEKIIFFLEGKKLYRSALLSRVKLKIIDNFDFQINDIFSDAADYFEDIYNEYPDDFLAIRFAAFKQLHDKNTKLYELFLSNFPLIFDYEIDLIDDTSLELFSYLNHPFIDTTNYKLLTEYCNKKLFSKDKLFYFFESLFLKNDRDISDIECKKLILSSIDFKNTIHFESMTEEQQKKICETFNNIYKLTTASGAMKYMNIINCLLPELEETVINNMNNEELDYSDYVNLINEIKKPTEKTVEIVRTKTLNQSLDTIITEKLYKKGFFVRYLIGKALYDNIIPIDENIPLNKYYDAFNLSENFAMICSEHEDILLAFAKNKLLNEKLTDDKLIYFYKLRQPLFLIDFMLTRLINNAEETKKYLYSIKDIDTEKDADDFINLITSNKYIELLKDKNLFYYLYHKMWNRVMKQKLTTKVNKLLGTDYWYKEADDYGFNKENSESQRDLDIPKQEQPS